MGRRDSVGSASTWENNTLGIKPPEAMLLPINYLTYGEANRFIDPDSLIALRESIRVSGLLNRVIINKITEPLEAKDRCTRVIAGWRRIKALEQLGEDYGAVPCLVFYDLNEEQEDYIRKAENVYQQPMTAEERAEWAAECRRMETGKAKKRDTRKRQQDRARLQTKQNAISRTNDLDIAQPSDPPPILYGWTEGMEGKTSWAGRTIRRKKAAIHAKAGVEVKPGKGKQYTAEESAALHKGLILLHEEEEAKKKAKASKKTPATKPKVEPKPAPEPAQAAAENDKREVALEINRLNAEYGCEALAQAIIDAGLAAEIKRML